jgi:hypothetical protein
MPLFEVAILITPTKNEAEDGKGETLAMAPKAVVARDAQSAAINAALDGGLPADVDRARMQVLVRPFA